MLSVIIWDDSYEINDDLFEIIEEYFRQKEIPVVIQQYYDSKKLIETMPFFDIMFLDIEMPKYNGIEVAKAFRKNQVGDRLSMLQVMLNMHKQLILYMLLVI